MSYFFETPFSFRQILNHKSIECFVQLIVHRNRKRISGPYHPSISLHSQMFAVSLDGRHVYTAGCWDNSLKVFSVSRGKPVASITKHLDIITCIALDNCGSYVVTGSKDCTCIIWSLSSNSSMSASSTASLTSSASLSSVNPPTTPTHQSQTIGMSQTNTQNSLTPRPLNTLYGHSKPVSCVAIFTELDMVVSGSQVCAPNTHNFYHYYVQFSYYCDINFHFIMIAIEQNTGRNCERAYD